VDATAATSAPRLALPPRILRPGGPAQAGRVEFRQSAAIRLAASRVRHPGMALPRQDHVPGRFISLNSAKRFHAPMPSKTVRSRAQRYLGSSAMRYPSTTPHVSLAEGRKSANIHVGSHLASPSLI
jgi:hypothetical protein